MITVLLLSCRRLHYLRRTVDAIRQHLADVEPGIQARFHCFDNGSTLADQRELQTLGFDLLMLSRENLGIGPAMNRLVSTVRTPYLLNLQDDWVVQNPRGIKFLAEAIGIMAADEKIAHIKLDDMHFTDFADRSVYDGPYQAQVRGVPFFVQNPGMLWGGFSFPPALSRTGALMELGPFREDQPFRRGWAESEFTQRYASRFVAAKSPDLLIFHHIGDEQAPGWTTKPGENKPVGVEAGALPIRTVPSPAASLKAAVGDIELSICITVRNRSRVPGPQGVLELFPRCVASLAASLKPGDPVELVISDWGSDDWPLQEWLSGTARHVPVKVVRVDEHDFSRGRGRNLAAQAARGSTLLFLDADMLVPPALIERAIACGREGSAFFPICYSYEDASHTKGWWRDTGYGLCAVTKDMLTAVGGWKEWRSYGGEDNVFFEDISARFPIRREPVEGFFHQWHPPSDDRSAKPPRSDWLEYVRDRAQKTEPSVR